MKKGTKIALMTAAVLLVLGMILCGIACAAVGFDLSALSVGGGTLLEETETTYAAGKVDKIVISTQVDDVRIVVSEDSDVGLSYTQWSDWQYTVTEHSGVLTLEQRSARSGLESWFQVNFTGRDYGKRQVELQLPEGFQGDVEVNADYGNVDLERAIHVTGEIACFLSAGNLRAVDLEAGAMRVESDLGDIAVNDCTFASDLTLQTNAGTVDLADVATAGTVDCQNDLGDVRAEQITAAAVELCTDAGDVKADRLQAENIVLMTDLGDVEGSIAGAESEYTIQVQTDLGESNLQDRTGITEKTLQVSTGAGDIQMAFTE